MENKIKELPKKKVSNSNGKKEAELRKEAIGIIKKKYIMNIGLSVLLVLVVAFGVSLIYLNSIEKLPAFLEKNTLAQKLSQLNENLFKRSEKLAAVVNQEKISMKDLDERYALVPPMYQQFITKEDVLTQMIDERVLLQEAKKMNYTATQEEIDEKIGLLLEQNQIIREEFEAAIESKNLTLGDVEDFYEKEILLGKLLDINVFMKIKISDTDIKDYYFRHPEIFTIPESINVSHILVCHNESQRCVSNLTKEEALEKAEDVKEEIDDENFAEIALEYSDEPAAKMTRGNLGWVSKEDPFDKTFMEAAFGLEEEEVSNPIETIFGYHLIKVFEKRPQEVLNLTTVYDQINQTLNSEKEKEIYNSYIGELRNESEIINYLEIKE